MVTTRLRLQPATTRLRLKPALLAMLSASSPAHSLLGKLPHLTSAANPRVKLAKKLLASRKVRDAERLVLVEGHRLLLDALADGHAPHNVFLTEEALESPEGARLAEALFSLPPSAAAALVPASLLKEMSDTETPQGVVAIFGRPALSLPQQPTLVLVLDGVSDPGNMGSLLRSAAGAGADAVLLLQGCHDCWSPKALRSGMGAQFRLPTASVSNWEQAAKQLEAWGCSLHAADAGGGVLHSDVDWRRPAALVLGSEAHGLSPEVCEDGRMETFRIPLMGGVESLNVAVAGSVVLFEVRRQRGVPESES